MLHALGRLCFVFVASCLAATALAQESAPADTDPLLSQLSGVRSLEKISAAIEAINASGPQQDLLPRLLAANPNAYVYAVQSQLRDGGYAVPLNAVLGRNTLAGLMAFCSANDIVAICARGPMLPAAASAIGAVMAAPAPTAAPASDTPPAPAAAPLASTAEPMVSASALPNGWSLDDASSVGIQTSIIAVNPSSATIRFEGVATADGWANIYFSPAFDVAASERWQITLGSAAAESGKPTGQSVRFLTARMGADSSYLGELFEGMPLKAAPERMERTATVPEGTVQLQPYVQVRFVAGEPLEVTVRVDDPAVAAVE